ncbi:hypothetical protein B4166_3612 [Caldibacillus thermoamylovorans]|uniref:Uncharacterized protein n=1 Tax=Caldibacillus thermoamylovorans TaxID=35841 RepID=A0ABD4AA84_9BACI|nr:hypothetical protein B4166_3612 [Caldibacillus thermoamylovorans]KIO73808.1 hypothetical protein B4167_1755 [Caldibacillus thermoamylovorans]
MDELPLYYFSGRLDLSQYKLTIQVWQNGAGISSTCIIYQM